MDPEPKRPAIVPELPRSLYLETTNRCDSKCQTCIRTFRTLEPPKDLTFEELKQIVDQFPVLDRVVLHGIGEPLLNRDLFVMIRYLKGKGATVLFNSDAISLNAAKRREIIASGLDEFRVSLDAVTPATYLKIRGVPTLPRVLENVRALVALRREMQSGTPRIGFWFTAMKENIRELPDLIRLAADVGVDEVYLQRLVFYDEGMAVKEQSLHGSLAATEREMIDESLRLAGELSLSFKASGGTGPRESLLPEDRRHPWRGCRRPWTLSYVTANGNLFPCCIAPWTARDYPGTILGNAFQDDFASLWNGEKYRAFREAFESDNPPDVCRGCGLWWSV